MTSHQFVAFVEAKLAEHSAEKIIPDEKLVAKAYAAMVRSRAVERAFAEVFERHKHAAAAVPVDLADQVRQQLA